MLSKKRAWELATMLTPVFNVFAAVEFEGRKKGVPTVSFTDELNSFFDPTANQVKISVTQLLEYFKVSTEAEFVAGAKYLLGHEFQHVHSTADKPYALGVKRGVYKILEYISKIEEPSKRRFRSDADYEYFCQKVLPSMSIHISFRYLVEVSQGIMNMLDDGRIERMRANKDTEFAKLRKVFNGKEWEENPTGEYSVPLTPSAKVEIFLNQILCLSLVQLYQRGFVQMFYGTEMFDDVNAFKPYIARSIMAGSCRDMTKESENIYDTLAPFIYEAAKQDAQNLENVLKDFLSTLEEMGIETVSASLSEMDEETDEGSCNTAFGKSDLVLEVTKEEYERLMENTTEAQENGGISVMLKIKDEDSDSDEHDEKSDGNSEKKESDAKAPEDEMSDEDNNSSDTDNIDPKDDSSENGKNKSSDKSAVDSDESNQPLDGQTSFSDSDFEEEAESEGESNGNLSDSDTSTYQQPEGGDQEDASNETYNETQKSKDGKFNMDKVGTPEGGDDETIEKDMKKAAETVNQLAYEMLDRINSFNTTTSKVKEVPDRTEPVLEKDMKDVLNGTSFTEYQRPYSLDQKLPSVLDARGRSMHRKLERYFRMQKSPKVSYLDQGSVDPNLIYTLAMKESNIFMREGKNKNTNDHVGYILVDRSGSMSGIKTKMVASAASVIESGLSGIIPLKIVAFDYYGGIRHEIIKNFDEVTKYNCSWNYNCHGRDGYGNEDSFDIAVATRELLKRRESKKLLLVLSDGAPGNRGAVKRAVDEARRNGIRVVALYFEEGMIDPYAVKVMEEMYTKDYICCPVNEIDGHLTKIFMQWAKS